MKTSFVLETDGSGYWSNAQRKVKIHRIEFGDYTNEVCVYFTKKSWDPDKHGLIYTDRKFINGLRKHMIALGIPKEIANDLDYTEQGMQSDDYVSLEFSDKSRRFLLNYLFARKNGK